MTDYPTLTVGAVEILPIHDVAGMFVPTEFIPQVPADAWDPYVDGDPAAPVDSRVVCYLIRSRAGLVLVDCGVGAWGAWSLGDGALLGELERHGIDREGIDVVMMTHLHYDHIGGAISPGPDGPAANFPNARHLVPRGDWEHFTAPAYLDGPEDAMTSAITHVILPLASLDLIDVVESDHVVNGDVTLLPTPGHTPGSTTICVQSEGVAALLIGDAAHHQAQLDHPDWSSAGDHDAAQAAASRRRILAEAVRLGAPVAAAHFGRDAPVFAPIVGGPDAYRWGGGR